MRRMSSLLALPAIVLAAGLATATAPPPAPAEQDPCWGQATAVFARTGEMGRHASQEPTPRLGLANLARALYDAGAIPEPTMSALGAFVADALGLSIEACGT